MKSISRAGRVAGDVLHADVDDGGDDDDAEQHEGRHLLPPRPADAERAADRGPVQGGPRGAPSAARALVGPVAAVVHGAGHASPPWPARSRNTSSSDVRRVVRRWSGSPSSATTSRTVSRSASACDLHLDDAVPDRGRERPGGQRGDQAVVVGADVDAEQPRALDERPRGAGHDEPARRRSSRRDRTPAARRRADGWPAAPRCRRSRDGRRGPSISSRPIGSSPAVGSSSSTSSGSATRAWASLVRWRMPVENPPMGRNRASSRPTRSSTSEARCRAARAGEAAELAEGGHHVRRRLVERQAVVLGHVAEPAAHADRVAGDVDAAHLEAGPPWGG